ncbi:hypothetical protein AAG906_017491 [Vitis piasezkii]
MAYINVWEHYGGGGHTNVDWSPIFEDLYSLELGFMDICVTRNPLGYRGSACVEVMTTLPISSEASSGLPTIGEQSIAQDEVPHDSLPSPPPPPPPLDQIVPQTSSYLLHGQSEVILPTTVHTTLRLFDNSTIWDDLEGIPVVSLLTKFRMPDIEKYTGVGCPRIHLRLYSTVIRAHRLDESQMITMFPLSLSGVD